MINQAEGKPIIRHTCLASVILLSGAMLGTASAQRFEFSLNEAATDGALRLTVTNSFYAPHRTTTTDRALRAIEEQIDQKRAADAARSPLDPFWEASFWKSPLMKLIPIGGGPQKLVEDPFVVPQYLLQARRWSDFEIKASDARARALFSP